MEQTLFDIQLQVSRPKDEYVLLSMEKFTIGKHFANKIWNAAKYILSNHETINPSSEFVLSVTDLNIADKWILTMTEELKTQVTQNFEKFRFNDLNRLDSLLQADPNKQFVNETTEIDRLQAIYETTADWDAVAVTVQGEWLRQLYEGHQSKLFARILEIFSGRLSGAGYQCRHQAYH